MWIPAGRVLVAVTLVLMLAVPLAGCERDDASLPTDSAPSVTDPAPDEPGAPGTGETDPPAAGIAWLDTELVDVLTGETFRISDFAGRPVLVKSFAVW